MKKKIIHQILALSFILFVIPTIILLFIARIERSNLSVIFLLVGGYIVILLGCIVYLIYRKILLPIAVLRKETGLISQGDLSKKITYQSEDEIGQFIQAFEQMRQALYIRQLEQEQFEIDRKEFIDSISHDLRTPIASISAYIEALQDEIAQTEEEKENYFSVIQSKITILQELSNQLNLSYQSFDAVALIREEISCFEWSQAFVHRVKADCLAKELEVKIDNQLSSDKKILKVDRLQLERALQNILDNAYRFTREVLLINIRQDNQHLNISIKNDGVTIKNDQLHQIFQKFYTKNEQNNEGHLGLGLAITDTLITAMDGQITAAISNGMILFTVTLPLFDFE
ncbi:HAMP domain-containing sensor histidine kinase [Candidatus Enterococcus willemsii]|uniref:histidine kinase n=1 Tax=Candidatus Enterococcus willemsii TaxID=1857215 RepID=A0ABQ6YVT1_9ENTE|nr:ATP-binding protein [Enterococcus sp. CU12B]KAF1301439.1 hypothetical protein BAU17_05805 [Enterococcus sp. CU12B]